MEATTPETMLISSAAQGDLEAFNELVLKYQDLVYRTAYAILGDHNEAEDATQDTFIRAFQHIGSFRGGSFRPWLLRITTNACYDALRWVRRHPAVNLFPRDADGNEFESPSWIADPHPSAQAQMEREELAQEVFRMLHELPVPYRTVITLVDLDGFDYADAARVLGIPTGTVKSRLARARHQMKQALSRDVGFRSELRVMRASAI